MAGTIVLFAFLAAFPAALALRVHVEDSVAWAPHEPRKVSHYCNNKLAFGNKMDFVPANEIMKSMIENRKHSDFFFVGTYDGTNIKDLVKQKWYKPEKVHIHGWEITKKSHGVAVAKTQGHPEVEIIHGAISDVDGLEIGVSGDKENAGIYEPGHHGHTKSFDATGETVLTQRWTTFVHGRNISEVAYALVDTEGHEMGVIGGMNLEHEKEHFPVFQYELGGTWVDGRHYGNMTQADAAKYLTNLGYRVYLMGEKHGHGLLAPADEQLFKDVKCEVQKGRYNVNSNALAVSEEAVKQMPWLAKAVDKMVSNDAKL